MGGIEEKLEKAEKAENFINIGKYSEGLNLFSELLLEKNTKFPVKKIYDKFISNLKKIYTVEIDFNTKIEILLNFFKFVEEEDKQFIITNILDLFGTKKSYEIIKYMKIINNLKVFELKYQTQKLLENKIIEENKSIIYSGDFGIFGENIDKLKNLYFELQYESTKQILRDKILEYYIQKGQEIFRTIIKLKKLNDIEKELKELHNIKNYLNEVNSPKESLSYIEELTKRSESFLLKTKGEYLMDKKDYESAYLTFKSIEIDRKLLQIEKLEIECIKKICQNFESEEKFDKALEYYKKYALLFELELIKVEILSHFKEAKIFLEKKNYYDSIINFVEMYKIKHKTKLQTQSLENIFTSCIEPFLSALSLFCLGFWNKNDKSNFKDYEKKVNDIYQNIDDILIKSNLEIILKFFNDIKILGKDKILKERIINEKNINSNIPEMLQRIYVQILSSFLDSKNNQEQIIKIVKVIIKYMEEGLYISKDLFINLRKLFSLDRNQDNKNILIIISKLFYIFSQKGMGKELEKNNIIIIGSTIVSLIKEKKLNKKLYTEDEYNEIMKNLFLSLEKLIKEKHYNLIDIEKVYNLALDSEITNKDLFDIVLNGFFYFYQINLIFSNKTINNLLTILLEKEKNRELFNIVFSTFEKYSDSFLNFIPKFFQLIFKYPEKEEEILTKINSVKNFGIILKNNNFFKVLDQYLDKNEVSDLIYSILNKIPISYRTLKVMEKCSFYEERKTKEKKSIIPSIMELNPEIKKRNIRLQEYHNFIKCGISLEKRQLKDIENNLNLNGFFDLLIILLEKQNNLIKELDLNIICKFFSHKNYKLFQIILANKIKFEKKHLITIIKGFIKNEENEKKLIIEFLENISKYQNLPEIVEKNLIFEKNFEIYEKMENIDSNKLLELLDKFKEIIYFSNKYFKTLNRLILFYVKDANIETDKKHKIFSKIIELLKSNTSLNVSVDILKLCINNMTLKEFIYSYSEILSNMRIEFSLKRVVFDKIYNILKYEQNEIKLETIKQMKYFIDWETIPSDILEILNSNFIINPNYNYPDISKEILYNFGVISSSFKENKIPKEFFEKLSKNHLYDSIKNHLNQMDNNFIIYIYSMIIYYNKNNIDRKDYSSIVRQILIEKIEEKLGNQSKIITFKASLKYFEEFHDFNTFSPKRDKFIRKLLFNKKININNISKILNNKCINEESKIEKTEGKKIDGKIFGFGKMYYTNGDYYIGYFLNNIKEGEGYFYKNDNPNKIKQVWKEGKLVEKRN